MPIPRSTSAPVEVRKWKVTGAEQVLTYPHPAVKLLNGTTPAAATYLHRDGLSSVRAITSAAGVKLEAAIYKPFGEQSEWVLPGNVAPETKGWIGERFDADAGLQYLNARYYDPELSLFLQPDWFEVTKPGVGTNRFSYSFNDPVNKIDPGGNQSSEYDIDDFYRELKDEAETVLPAVGKEVVNAGVHGAGLLGKIAYEGSPLGAVDNIYHGYQEGNYWEVTLGVVEIAPWGKFAKWAVRASRTTSTLTGTVKVVSEAMSPRARAYQARVTGMAEGTAYVQNGVKFDGYDEAAGLLIDAKYGMDFMVDSAGSFKSWSRLPDKVIDQAKRQLDAAGDASVEWRFSDERVALAVRDLFSSENLAINVVHVP
ncbi:Rhs repeat-associated core [Paracoccaceae bacterium]